MFICSISVISVPIVFFGHEAAQREGAIMGTLIRRIGRMKTGIGLNICVVVWLLIKIIIKNLSRFAYPAVAGHH